MNARIYCAANSFLSCGLPPAGRRGSPGVGQEQAGHRAPRPGRDLMRAGELRSFSLFNGLTDDQLAELVDGGTEVRVEPGVELFREGEHADFWWVLVDGSVDLVRRIGREETLVGKMDVPGRWAGGFCAWDEHGVYLATGRGATDGRVLRVPAEVLRERADAWFPFARHLFEGA